MTVTSISIYIFKVTYPVCKMFILNDTGINLVCFGKRVGMDDSGVILDADFTVLLAS